LYFDKLTICKEERMRRQHYDRVIREWCAATGMPPWNEDDDKHIEIDGTICGLIPGGEDEPDVMHVLIDLGPEDDAGLYRYLLEQNTPLGNADHGCFGLHPVTGSVVYRACFHLSTSTDGTLLPEKIYALLESARDRLSALYVQ
jgi:hypothetical protein